MIANFAFIPCYPIWSLAIIAVYLAVIWALTAHGRDVVADDHARRPLSPGFGTAARRDPSGRSRPAWALASPRAPTDEPASDARRTAVTRGGADPRATDVSVRNRARFVARASRPDRAEHASTTSTATTGASSACSAPRLRQVHAGRPVGRRGARHVGWIDVERIDNDPLVLAAAVARALTATDGTCRTDGTRFDGPGSSGSSPRGWGPLDRIDRPFLLVLDDVHNIDSEASVALVDALAEHLPRSSTLVLCGRSHPDQRLARPPSTRPWGGRLTATHLALDATETDELLALDGCRPGAGSPQRSSATASRDGPPVRLAGLALRGDGERWRGCSRPGRRRHLRRRLPAIRVDRPAVARRPAVPLRGRCLDRFTG